MLEPGGELSLCFVRLGCVFQYMCICICVFEPGGSVLRDYIPEMMCCHIGCIVSTFSTVRFQMSSRVVCFSQGGGTEPLFCKTRELGNDLSGKYSSIVKALSWEYISLYIETNNVCKNYNCEKANTMYVRIPCSSSISRARSCTSFKS